MARATFFLHLLGWGFFRFQASPLWSRESLRPGSRPPLYRIARSRDPAMAAATGSGQCVWSRRPQRTTTPKGSDSCIQLGWLGAMITDCKSKLVSRGADDRPPRSRRTTARGSNRQLQQNEQEVVTNSLSSSTLEQAACGQHDEQLCTSAMARWGCPARVS